MKNVPELSENVRQEKRNNDKGKRKRERRAEREVARAEAAWRRFSVGCLKSNGNLVKPNVPL